jgi:hypothetical protein
MRTKIDRTIEPLDAQLERVEKNEAGNKASLLSQSEINKQYPKG